MSAGAAFGPEISDLVVDYDQESLDRRPVDKSSVLREIRARGLPARAARVVRAMPEGAGGALDSRHVDEVLVRSHLELQRLHEEFRVGATMRDFVAPMLAAVRARTSERPVRVVDLGCGLGFVTRWLASHGGLGEDVALVGVDYNRALVGAASRLAREEGLSARFLAANAFRLEEPAHVVISTGVLHHFRGDDLARVFGEHERAGALGFVHLDIRPSAIAPIGSFIFHQARMREPLARFDGYWSAVRAHPAAELVRAARTGAPRFDVGTLDAEPGIFALVRIFQAVVGLRSGVPRDLARTYDALGRRFEPGEVR